MRSVLTITIDATPSTVFGWLATPERAKVWMTSVGETEVLVSQPGVVGTTFREVVRDGGGRVEMTGTITAFEPDRRIAFHLASRVNTVDVAYVVEPGPPARLVVDAEVRWRLPIRLIALVMGRHIRASIEAQTRSELERLKGLCEAETRSSVAAVAAAAVAAAASTERT